MPTYQDITESISRLPAPRPTGIWGVLDYLDRPRATLSEAIGAAYAGDDIMDAAWRGLTEGYTQSKYGTLGQMLFPDAKERGFQMADIPAFGVDVISDPLLYLGPGILRAGGKVAAKGALALGRKFIPPVKTILGAVPGSERTLSFTKKMGLLRGELGRLGLTKWDTAKRISQIQPGTHTPDDIMQVFKRKGKMKVPGTFAGQARPQEAFVDFVRGGLRDLNINYQPDVQTALHSITANAGRALGVPMKMLRIIGGPAGTKWGDLWEKGLFGTAFRYTAWDGRLKSIYRGTKEADRVASSMLHEKLLRVSPHGVLQFVDPKLAGLASAQKLIPQGVNVKKAQELSVNLKGVTDDFWADIIQPKHKDAFGRFIQTTDRNTGKVIDLPQAFEPDYYPHLFPRDAFTRKGRKSFRDKLKASGMDDITVDNYIRENLGHQPKTVGHVQYTRLTNELGYEHDPLKAVPKYIYDTIMKQEMSKGFGAKNEILDTMVGDLKAMGVNAPWLDKLVALTVGRNPYDMAMDGLFRTLNTVQAIGKLGYATSIANLGQAPFNIASTRGFPRFFKALGGVVDPRPEFSRLGPASFNRGLEEDVIKAATGGRSFFGDFYMKAVGFPFTERVGRHVGAMASYMEADEMAKTWARLRLSPEPKALKEAGRIASELGRRYKIPTSLLESVGGNLPREVLEHAGLRGSRVTMHAFDMMELPIGWRHPFWRMALQFKSFIYKQTEFMASEVMVPALHHLASDGARGDIWPLLRMMAVAPVMSQTITHLRDLTKSIPSHLWEGVTKGKPAKWNYRDPFWDDPDPFSRMFTDIVYVGTLGLVGDAYEAASRGRLADWLLGPSVGQATELAEALAGRQSLGRELTRALPGALGIPSRTNVFEGVID